LRSVRVVDLFPDEHESVLDMLGTLSEAQWATATACPGWSIHDVALRILGDDVSILSSQRDGCTDRGAAEGVDVSRWDELLAFIDRRNDEWVRATRRISPPLLRELLGVTGPAICRHFAQGNPDALGGSVSWASAGPAPVWPGIAREQTE
jgi:hypothetical protein